MESETLAISACITSTLLSSTLEPISFLLSGNEVQGCPADPLPLAPAFPHFHWHLAMLLMHPPTLPKRAQDWAHNQQVAKWRAPNSGRGNWIRPVQRITVNPKFSPSSAGAEPELPVPTPRKIEIGFPWMLPYRKQCLPLPAWVQTGFLSLSTKNPEKGRNQDNCVSKTKNQFFKNVSGRF